MTNFFLAGFCVAILAIGACAEPTAPAESAASSAAVQSSIDAEGVIPQAQLDAMAKAAATSSVLEQAEQERRKQMEAQGL